MNTFVNNTPRLWIVQSVIKFTQKAMVPLGITLALFIRMPERFTWTTFGSLFFTIYNSYSIMSLLAPTIFSYLPLGTGFGIGQGLTGIEGFESDDVNVDKGEKCICPVQQQQPVQGTEAEPLATRFTSWLPETVQQAVGAKPVKQEPEVMDVEKRENLCKALEKAGFNPEWTFWDIKQLMRSERGLYKLETIDRRVKNETGFQRITNDMLEVCYPGYMRGRPRYYGQIPNVK